ncbi:type IV secretion system protein VirB6 [Rhodanobacter sp. ANJX3]|uniref:type IV secretion system protein n=1 Tax=Rhodanobacter sp. ANJX3 TaxID=2723083 RepID=UPI001616B4E2|nr:type IV secretion system protein [Rhodanobacter sp. ANJX3]MBB5359137.1 type IV secretion system protein VirB6 [Rhodanobacter sp. ANJX3]
MNLAIYALVFNYINNAINDFMIHLMNEMMQFVSGIALLMITIWIMMVGFRVVTGQMREPLMGVVVNMARIGFIVTVATGMSIFGSDIHTLATTTLPSELNQMFTGNSDTIIDAVNKNLAETVFAMGAIDAVQAPPGDVQTVTQKARASDFAIFGTASPPVAVGTLMLMYNFAIALFVGLGPLFILCLIFNKTKALFEKWLMYGIATLFSLAMLSFISAIVLQVTLRAAVALWSSNAINNLIGVSSEGLSTQSLEQGGIGVMMTMLVLSVPPMAGNFFSSTLGNFMHFSAFGGGIGGGRPGPQGQPAGSYGMPPSNTGQSAQSGFQAGSSGFNNPGLVQPRQTAATDSGVRTNPQFGNAPTAPPSSNG